jgi:Tol biopolymer transport system component
MTTDLDKPPLPSLHSHGHPGRPVAEYDEWQQLRGNVRHLTVGMLGEIFAILRILLQDAIILVVGFAVEFAFEHWLHSEQPFFRIAINISSAMFLLLYGVMVTVHVVHYVREQFGITAAGLLTQYIPWALAAAGVIAAVVALNVPRNNKGKIALVPSAVSRMTINLPADFRLDPDRKTLAVSPNGKWIAFSSADHIDSQIYLRAIDSFASKPMPGTENGRAPFFSPDSEWLGFYANNYLKKIRVGGGSPEIICEAIMGGGITGPFSGAWGEDGTIVFQFVPIGELWKVSAAGGKPEKLNTKNTGDISNRWPALLPDGSGVLFASSATNTIWNAPQLAVFSFKKQERYDLVPGATAPVLSPTGHLLFVRDGNLHAQEFNSSSLQVEGEPISLVEGVRQSRITGVAQYALSDNGTLAYISGGANIARRELFWVDRQGKAEKLQYSPSAYRSPRISPDGKRIAIANEELGGQIWMLDQGRETLSRLTFQAPSEEAGNINPVWTPDGKHISFQSRRGGAANIFWQPADGSGQAERLTSGKNTQSPATWSSDGKTLIFMEVTPETTQDMWIMNMDDREPRPIMNSKFSEAAGRISPDGRWFAYVSDQSGRREIYLTTFPSFSGQWQISNEGGQEPVWNPNGGELFYRNGAKMMSVDLTAQPNLSLGKPRVLFEGVYLLTLLTGANYDVTPDGKRFIMLKDASPDNSPTQINIVLNWFEELKQKVPMP